MIETANSTQLPKPNGLEGVVAAADTIDGAGVLTPRGFPIPEDLVTEAGRIIRENDVEAVHQLTITDDEMDDLHREVFRTLLSPDWDSGVEAAIDATLLSRYYERFGDHAVSVAHRIVYLVTGEWGDDHLDIDERLDVTEVRRPAHLG